MSTTKHTAEPWQQTYGAQRDPVCTWPIATAVGNEPSEFYIHGMNEKYGTVDNEANAARIVACVNACAGIEDPAKAMADAKESLALALISAGARRGQNGRDLRGAINAALRALGG